MTKDRSKLGFSTRAIHHDYDPLDYHGSINPPVFLSSTFSFDSSATGTALFAGETQGYFYSRVDNPTVAVLENRLAALEEGEAGLATSSGMGALTAVILTLLKSGARSLPTRCFTGAPSACYGIRWRASASILVSSISPN